MPHYTIDEHGNAKVVDEKNDEAFADKLKKASTIVLWVVIVACVAVFLIFYIDVPATSSVTVRTRTVFESNLLTSNYFINHLSAKWTALVTNVENIWLLIKTQFLAFRQEVR